MLVSEKWVWKDHRWIHSDRKTMMIEAVDTTTAYQLDLQLTHEESYAYQNLYIRTLTTFPSGKVVTSVTSLELTDDKGGWAGNYGENCCTIRLPLQRKFTFPEVGTYSWTIEPYMRMDTVKGITSLKVTCRKWKE